MKSLLALDQIAEEHEFWEATATNVKSGWRQIHHDS